MGRRQVEKVTAATESEANWFVTSRCPHMREGSGPLLLLTPFKGDFK
jgi:hypothetical protein